VIETGRPRSINREKFSRVTLENSLKDPVDIKSRVFSRYRNILRQRISCSAFHPFGKQVVIIRNPSIFSLVRYSPNEKEVVLCLVNVSDEKQSFRFKLTDWQFQGLTRWRDLINGDEINTHAEELHIDLQPYQSCWFHTENK
jgi:sucrose phosphorylase